jgi:hypothetical protein
MAYLEHMTTRKLQPLKEFNAEVVQKPLNGLLTNVSREVERSLKQAMKARNLESERLWSLLFMMLRLATCSYESVSFLLVSAQDDPKLLSRRALAIPPINRQMMDALFSLVYMMDDFSARSLDYEISGYRQLRELIDNYFAKYGAELEWQPYLDSLKDLQSLTEHYLPITTEQKNDPKGIPRWPPPSRLIKKNTASQPFLNYMHTWLYNDTSAQAHLNAVGLAQVGAFVLTSVAPEHMQRLIEERTIKQYTYVHFTRTMIVVLAIATEIDAYRNFANREAIERLWGLLSGFVAEAKDVYQQRYEAMLR